VTGTGQENNGQLARIRHSGRIADQPQQTGNFVGPIVAVMQDLPLKLRANTTLRVFPKKMRQRGYNPSRLA
jgi:hypothetical protein